MHQLSVSSSDVMQLRQIAFQIQESFPGITVVLFQPVKIEELENDAPKPLIDLIADALKPRPTGDTFYTRLLRGVRWGRDSLDISNGEALASPRSETKKVTDRLKKAFPGGDVTREHLFVSKQVHFEDGSYKGVEYVMTPLGRKVLDELNQRGELSFPGETGPLPV